MTWEISSVSVLTEIHVVEYMGQRWNKSPPQTPIVSQTWYFQKCATDEVQYIFADGIIPQTTGNAWFSTLCRNLPVVKIHPQSRNNTDIDHAQL